MSIHDVLAWIYALPVADHIRTSIWLFPAIESIHVLAILFVIGSISRVDLRLLGVIWRDRPITQVSDELLPWTWTSFVVAAAAGSFLFTSAAIKYSGNIFFDVKMVLIVLAGINMLVFQFVTYRTVDQWNMAASPPVAAKIAGALSLTLWIGVVACGRFIGFT